jgi:HEAT repeat protein
MRYLQTGEDGHYAFIHLLLRDTLVYGFSLPRLRNVTFYTSQFTPNPALAIGAIKDKRAFEPLVMLLCDPTGRWLREEAVRGLGRLGDVRALPYLAISLADVTDNLQYSSAVALGDIKHELAILPLIVAMSDVDNLVRNAASLAITRIGKPAVKPLIYALSHPNKYLRTRIAYALGQIGDPQAVSPLTRLLDDKSNLYRFGDDRVCDYVAKALEYIATPEALAAVNKWRAEGSGRE